MYAHCLVVENGGLYRVALRHIEYHVIVFVVFRYFHLLVLFAFFFVVAYLVEISCESVHGLIGQLLRLVIALDVVDG